MEKVGEKPVELSVITEIEEEIAERERIWSFYQSFTEGCIFLLSVHFNQEQSKVRFFVFISLMCARIGWDGSWRLAYVAKQDC